MKTPKILIVEDILINSRLYQAYLNKFSIECLIAENGLDGLNKVRENPDIDIVIMNYVMPVMDGLESTLKIRKFNQTIPIIMTSASIVPSKELVKKLEEVGCNDYLIVPFESTQFVRKIENYLGYQLTKK